MFSFSLINLTLTILLLTTTIMSVSSLLVPMDRVDHPDEYQYSPIFYRFHPKKDNDYRVGQTNEGHPSDKRRSTHSISALFPRASRNAWFRIATYQNYKPVNSEEAMSTENPMRWGRRR